MPPGQAGTHGANDAGLQTQFIQGIGKKMREAGLAIGASHGYHLHRTAWVPMIAGSNVTQALIQVGHLHHRHRKIGWRWLFRYDCNSTPANGINSIIAAITAKPGVGKEDVTRLHLAAIVCQPLAPDILAELFTRHEFTEHHVKPSSFALLAVSSTALLAFSMLDA